MGRPLSKEERQHRIDEARRKSIAARPKLTLHPHTAKKFKTIPMRDRDGKPIPQDPEIIHGGPWPEPIYGIVINEQNAHQTKRR